MTWGSHRRRTAEVKEEKETAAVKETKVKAAKAQVAKEADERKEKAANERKPILLSKDHWKKVAKKRGCFWDSRRWEEFPFANREKDLSKPPYPFDLSRCILRCKEKGFRFAAVRSEKAPTWFADENKFYSDFGGGKSQTDRKDLVYNNVAFEGPTGRPHFNGKCHRHKLSKDGPPIGPTPICVCGNAVGLHGTLGPACEKTCDAKTTAAAFGTNMNKQKNGAQVGRDKRHGRTKGFQLPSIDDLDAVDGNFDRDKFDNTCNLPCPRCWSANKAGNWPGGPVGHWCKKDGGTGLSCQGFPYDVCQEFRVHGRHIVGVKGAKWCAQGMNCGFNVQQAHWSHFQPGTQCGGLNTGDKLQTKRYFNVVYEIKKYDRKHTHNGLPVRTLTTCAGGTMQIGSNRYCCVRFVTCMTVVCTDDVAIAVCKETEEIRIISAFYGRHKAACEHCLLRYFE